MTYTFLPLLFLRFWYLEAPLEILRYFASLNKAVSLFFSIELMLKTFFKPIKNEYREGLVGFSIGMGILVKISLLIVAALVMLLIIIAEIIAIGLFLLFPILSIYVIFL